MLSRWITTKQLTQYMANYEPEKLVEGWYVWWLIRQGQDIVISWEYGNVFSCTIYFPATTDDYGELLKMAGAWKGAHGWDQVETLARFRINQIDQTLNDLRMMTRIGGTTGGSHAQANS